MSDFGRVLKEIRKSYDLSQRQLGMKYGRLQGKEDGVAPSVIAGWESGQRSPSQEVIATLVKALEARDDEHDRLLMAAGYLPAHSTNVPVKKAVEILTRLASQNEELSEFTREWIEKFESECLSEQEAESDDTVK